MSLFDRYGIKEVADVTFYALDDNNPGVPGKPVLYLDTLKVSTIEQTAENTDARGGKGNTALMSWDYGKEITVNLEDALFSRKSLSVMYDGKISGVETIHKTTMLTFTTPVGITTQDDQEAGYIRGDASKVPFDVAFENISNVIGRDQYNEGSVVAFIIDGKKYSVDTTKVQMVLPDGDTINPWHSNIGPWEAQLHAVDVPGYDVTVLGLPAGTYLFEFDVVAENGTSIDVSANSFPGTYYVTGDTYVRNEKTGKDEFFQFIIPKAKLLSENNTITLEADGEPTVFNMNLKVLKSKNAPMMSLVQYNI